jgi:hypothetical protein
MPNSRRFYGIGEGLDDRETSKLLKELGETFFPRKEQPQLSGVSG